MASIIPELRALKSRAIQYKGQTIVLYHIKAMADFVGMSHEGLKAWRRTGVLPDSLFWRDIRTNLVRSHCDGRIVLSGRMHYYTVEEMLTFKHLRNKFGMRRATRVEFTGELHHRFSLIRERVENGQSAADLAPMSFEISSLKEFAENIRRVFFRDEPCDVDNCIGLANLLLSTQPHVT